MDIRKLIGMPLWYAKSVLEREMLSYTIVETASRSHFFTCEKGDAYVIRTKELDDHVIELLVNDSLQKSESVCRVLQGGE